MSRPTLPSVARHLMADPDVEAAGLGLAPFAQVGAPTQKYDGCTVTGGPHNSVTAAVTAFLNSLWSATEGKEWGWRSEPELLSETDPSRIEPFYMMRARVYWLVPDEGEPTHLDDDIVENIRKIFGDEVANKYKERHDEA